MSYILDALNKSEKERAAKKAPGLSSLQDEPKTRRFSARHYVLGLLLLAIVNSVLVYWFFEERLKEPVAVTDVSPAQPAVTPVIPEVVPTPAASSFAELPLSIQEAISGIEVTAHIYAADKTLRMVKIDGVELYEGDPISADITLAAITETGVIVESRGYEHPLEVLEDWD